MIGLLSQLRSLDTTKAKNTILCSSNTLWLNNLTILIIYVDDIIFTGDDLEETIKSRNILAKEFEIKDLGQLNYILGMDYGDS